MRWLLALSVLLALAPTPVAAQSIREVGRCVAGNVPLCFRAAGVPLPDPLPGSDALESLARTSCEGGDPHGCVLGALLDGLRAPETREGLLPLCEAGDASACVVLGLGRLMARVDPTVPLGRACDAGSDVGCALQVMVTMPAPAAHEALVTLCESGGATACNLAGEHFDLGEDAPRDPARAAQLFTRACTLGNAWGCIRQALGLLGEGAPPADLETARGLLEGACNAGEAVGCHQLGIMHMHGEGVAEDPARAAALFREACVHGEPGACVALGVSHERGRGVERSTAMASALYELACTWSDGTGCTYWADLLAVGTGDGIDLPGALAAWARGCELGEEHACAQVHAHERLRRDPVDVATLPAGRDSCERDPEACVRAADRLATGVGIARDVTAAAALYQTACRTGSARACGALGALLRHGVGVVRDEARATTLLGHACSSGESWACESPPPVRTPGWGG